MLVTGYRLASGPVGLQIQARVANLGQQGELRCNFIKQVTMPPPLRTTLTNSKLTFRLIQRRGIILEAKFPFKRGRGIGLYL